MYNSIRNFAILLLTCASTMAFATSGTLLLKADHPEPQIGNYYARNIAVTPAGHILTGAQLRGENGQPSAGVAYLLDGATGALKFALRNPDPVTDDRFGAFIATTDSFLVVSAFFKDDGAFQDSGRVYLFSPKTGELVRTILNPSPATNDQFGYGICGLGEFLVVGSRGDNAAGHETGTVYIFNPHTGALVQTIVNPAPTSGDLFGFSVEAVGTDKILVGAPAADYGATDSGAAFLMDAWTGQLLQTYVSPDPIPFSLFGYMLAARGDDLVISAPPANLAAYHFSASTGLLKNRLVNPDPQAVGTFGAAAFVGSDILIGNAFYERDSIAECGRAYLYDSTTGDLLRTFDNPDNTGSRFGISLDSHYGKWVIGAPYATVGSVTQAGTIFVYEGRFGFAAADDWQQYY